MHNRSDMTPWLLLKEAITDIPNNPTTVVAALILTGLAASMVLSGQVTDLHVSEGAYTRAYPAGVFRTPHPTVLATERLFND